MAAKLKTGLLVAGAVSWLAATGAYAQSTAQSSPPANPRPAADPNQRVCETVTVLGSRLGAKKICATRAEWAERRKQDRDSVESGQRAANIGCNTINTHTGAPSC